MHLTQHICAPVPARARRARRACATGLLAGTLLAPVHPASAPAADAVRVARFEGGPSAVARPGSLGIGAKGVVEQIAWRTWGGRTAKGSGIYDIAGFAGEPGSGYHARVGLTFSGRRTCGSKRVYTTLTLHLTKPIGGRSTLKLAGYTRCARARAAASRAAVTRRCGDLGHARDALHVSNVRATGTSCATARRVASTWRSKAGCGQLPAGGPTTCARILGYACTRVAGSGEAMVFRCAKASRTVRFDAGS